MTLTVFFEGSLENTHDRYGEIIVSRVMRSLSATELIDQKVKMVG